MRTVAGPIICLAFGALTAAAAETPVETGRKALGQWNRYPWYDSSADAAKPVDVSPPPDLSFWDWLGGFSLGGSWIVVLGWIALAAALAVLIYLMIRVVLGWRPVVADLPEPDDEFQKAEEARRFDALPSNGPRSRSNLLEEARRHYEAGDYGEAIIYLFSYQLFQLDKHQLIRLTKGKTNRQYVRELGAREKLVYLLTATMTTFEDVFFGNHRIDRRRFESCWGKLDEFEGLVGSGE